MQADSYSSYMQLYYVLCAAYEKLSRCLWEIPSRLPNRRSQSIRNKIKRNVYLPLPA